MREKDFVTLMKFRSTNRAAIFKTMLDSMGVESQLINDTASNVVLPMMFNDVRLIVRSDDVEHAREILKAKFDPNELKEYMQ